MLRARAVASRKIFTQPRCSEPRKNCSEPVKLFIRCDERGCRAQSCLCCCNCSITTPKSPCNFELPPHLAKFAEQITTKVGHSCPENKTTICKKFWYSSRYLQLNGLQISTELFAFAGPIWRCDNRTHLVSPREPPKHQKRDQIAHWILMAPAPAVANFNTDYGNLNCTYTRVREDPSRPRLTEVMKMTIVFLLYIIGKYNSDRDMLDQSSRSLDTITLSNSPRG